MTIFNNEKMFRELFCEKCNIYYVGLESDARCNNCREKLITTVYSVLTKERITNNQKFKFEMKGE